eukprot:Transcript_16832.p2 GENE.Transcript_16832~~Transcript_16832.p2  ORF type:complete len:223 (-),score=60.68 Transcript_16832:79-747(-)
MSSAGPSSLVLPLPPPPPPPPALPLPPPPLGVVWWPPWAALNTNSAALSGASKCVSATCRSNPRFDRLRLVLEFGSLLLLLAPLAWLALAAWRHGRFCGCGGAKAGRRGGQVKEGVTLLARRARRALRRARRKSSPRRSLSSIAEEDEEESMVGEEECMVAAEEPEAAGLASGPPSPRSPALGVDGGAGEEGAAGTFPQCSPKHFPGGVAVPSHATLTLPAG